MGFMGEFTHTLDKKGRIAIPAKLREGLGDTFIVTKGLDKCLFIYTVDGWEKLVERMKSLSMAKAKARAFKRTIFSAATPVEPDKQGRILIPQKLREYANFYENVVVVGVDDRVEMWAEELWDNYSEAVNEDYEDNAEELDIM